MSRKCFGWRYIPEEKRIGCAVLNDEAAREMEETKKCGGIGCPFWKPDAYSIRTERGIRKR